MVQPSQRLEDCAAAAGRRSPGTAGAEVIGEIAGGYCMHGTTQMAQVILCTHHCLLLPRARGRRTVPLMAYRHRSADSSGSEDRSTHEQGASSSVAVVRSMMMESVVTMMVVVVVMMVPPMAPVPWHV